METAVAIVSLAALAQESRLAASKIAAAKCGRSIIYSADFTAIKGLLAFMAQNCGGSPCSPAGVPLCAPAGVNAEPAP